MSDLEKFELLNFQATVRKLKIMLSELNKHSHIRGRLGQLKTRYVSEKRRGVRLIR